MERYKKNDKWCDKHTQSLAAAAMSALDLKKLRGRTETHAFLVYIDVHEHIHDNNPRRIKFTRTIRNAACVDMSTEPDFQNSANLGRSLALRPGTIRIHVIDDGLPLRLQLQTLACDTSRLTPAQMHDHPDWLERLKLKVDDRVPQD